MAKAVRCSLLTLSFLIVSVISHAQIIPFLSPWSYTAEEMEPAFRYQQNFGGHVRNRIMADGCLLGDKETVASYEGDQLSVPCRFIGETIRHLKEILEKGAAKYLFPLDVGHAHFVLPKGLWQKKYSKLDGAKRLSAFLREPKLAALYHTAEFLTILDRKTGKVNSEAKAWKEKRNVLAFYDGRPIQILPPDPSGAGVGPPRDFESFNKFNFIANPRGLFVIFHRSETINFDITFEGLSSKFEAKKSTN